MAKRTMQREDFEACAKAMYHVEQEMLRDDRPCFAKLVKFQLGEPGQLKRISDPFDLSPLFKDGQGKDAAAAIFNLTTETISNSDAWHMCAMISEAWTLEGKNIEAPKKGSLESHPDRREAVIMVIRSPDSEGLAIFPIDRKMKTLERREVFFSPEAQGRFVRPKPAAH